MTLPSKKQPQPGNPGDVSLRFDFNAAAKKALKDHPELRGRQMFLHAGRDEPGLFIDSLIRRGADDDDIEELEKTVREAKRLKTSFHQAVSRERGKPIGVLVFHPDKHSVFGPSRGPADDAGTFDHELGHALTPDLHGTSAENMADGFAALRHFQRFAVEQNQNNPANQNIEYAAWKRAAISMLTGTTSHLTTFTLDKILVDAKTADFSSLTPEQAKKIAEDYAAKMTPSPKRLAKINRAFAPLKKMKPQEAMEKLAAITLRAGKDSDIFYLGARVLRGALQDGGTRLDGRPVKLSGEEWESVRDRLEAKIAKLPKSHILRRLTPPSA